MTTTISAITFVGIDVSKDELVIAYYEQGHLKKCKVKNTVETITDWLCQLPIKGVNTLSLNILGSILTG